MSISFKINTKGLLAGIQPAVIVSTSGVVKESPTANLIALEATPEHLFASANGGRISVRNPTPYITTYCTEYHFKQGGTAVVRTSDLIAALSSFEADAILLVEVVEGDGTVEIPEDATDEEKAYFNRVNEAMTGTALRIQLDADPKQYQSMPILAIPLTVASSDKKPDQQIVVSRASLARGMARVLFAGGFEERRERFMYWALRAGKDSTRYVAGTGSRFALTNQKGEQISNASDGKTLLIPVEQSQVVLKTLGETAHATVTIKHYGNQIAFEAGDMRIVMAGLNPHIQWIDENKILSRTNLYKFTLSLSELELAVKGMLATNSEEAKKRNPFHDVTLSFDASNKIVSLSSSRYTKKAIRKAKISDAWVAENQPAEISFKCIVGFLAEMPKYADKSTYVQFELVSKDLPLIARFYSGEKVSQTPLTHQNDVAGIEEDYVMLVAKLSEDK